MGPPSPPISLPNVLNKFERHLRSKYLCIPKEFTCSVRGTYARQHKARGPSLEPNAMLCMEYGVFTEYLFYEQGNTSRGGI